MTEEKTMHTPLTKKEREELIYRIFGEDIPKSLATISNEQILSLYEIGSTLSRADFKQILEDLSHADTKDFEKAKKENSTTGRLTNIIFAIVTEVIVTTICTNYTASYIFPALRNVAVQSKILSLTKKITEQTIKQTKTIKNFKLNDLKDIVNGVFKKNNAKEKLLELFEKYTKKPTKNNNPFAQTAKETAKKNKKTSVKNNSVNNNSDKINGKTANTTTNKKKDADNKKVEKKSDTKDGKNNTMDKNRNSKNEWMSHENDFGLDKKKADGMIGNNVDFNASTPPIIPVTATGEVIINAGGSINQKAESKETKDEEGINVPLRGRVIMEHIIDKDDETEERINFLPQDSTINEESNNIQKTSNANDAPYIKFIEPNQALTHNSRYSITIREYGVEKVLNEYELSDIVYDIIMEQLTDYIQNRAFAFRRYWSEKTEKTSV